MVSGCSDTVAAAITAYDSTKVKIQLPVAVSNNGLCINAPAISLSADIAGGSFTVNGSPNAGSFNPSSVGNFNIIYSYTNANSCVSSDRTSITVHALPTIASTIATSDLTACSNGGPISLSGMPSSLIFAGTAVNYGVTGYTFNPKTAGAGSFPISYSYTDNNNCSNSASTTVTVTDIQPPTVKDLSFYSFNYPKIITATGTNLIWYGKKGDKSDSLLAAPQLTNTDLKTRNYSDSLNIASAIPYPFYVTQSIGKCQSDVAKITVTILNCTAQAPLISDSIPNSCLGATFKTITVKSHVNGDVTHWYDANKKLIATGNSFTPLAANLANPGISILYVADSLLGEGCKSVLSKITYTVNNVTTPSITNPGNICQPSIAGTKFTAMGDGGTIQWTFASQTFTGTDLLLSTAGITTGQTLPYIFKAIQIKGFCKSDTAYSTIIVSPIPSKPVMPVSKPLCFGPALSNVSAINPNGIVNWYRNPSQTTGVSMATGTLLASSMDPTTGTHSYYATIQMGNTCTSDTATYTYIINRKPQTPIGTNVWKCASTIALQSINVNVIDPKDTAIWSTVSTPQIPIAKGLSYTQKTITDTDFVVLAQSNGCQSDTIKLQIKPYTPTASPIITTAHQSFCKGGSTILNASGNYIKWFDQNKKTLDSNVATYNYSDTSVGPHTFFASLKMETPDHVHLCESAPSQITITVRPKPNPVSIAQQTLCAYDPIVPFIVTNYTGNDSIIWQNDSGKQVGIGKTFAPTITPGNSTVYYTTVVKDGCYSNGNNASFAPYHMLNVVPKPSISQSPKIFCIGSSEPLQITINATLPSYTWLDSTNNKTSIKSILANAQNPGNYTIKAYQTDSSNEKACNSDNVVFVIHSYKTPTPSIYGKDSLCEKSYSVLYNIDNLSLNPNSNYLWTVTGNVNNYAIDNKQLFNRAFDFINPAIDTISVLETSKNGCSNTASKIVRVAPSPKAFFTTETPGQEGEIFFYNNSQQEPIHGKQIDSIANKYFWNFGRSFDRSAERRVGK